MGDGKIDKRQTSKDAEIMLQKANEKKKKRKNSDEE